MERLYHDLNLALEESNCGRQERRRLGLRRRTRSAGNLPAAVAVSLVEDGSSSSPPQAPLITQPLSDSDDPQLNIHKSSGLKTRHYCQIGNFESDSFNENFSPTRPANARRKRKYKKMQIPVEYTDEKTSPPIEILSITAEGTALPGAIVLQPQAVSAPTHLTKHKPERNVFCGKRKWSHRDKGDGCEMRERSFSGGCSSKSAFFKNDFKCKKYDTEKKRKESVLQPGKIVLKSQNNEGTPSTFTNTPSLPGSSSFNFVYKSSKNGTPTLSKLTGYKITTDLPPFFSPTTSTGKYHRKFKMFNKSHPPNSLRNPLQFDDSNSGMDCAGNESSSLSSSDSDGVVTNDSDREGDDELTDWPGIEELKVFNKSLTFKSSKSVNNNTVSTMPPPKRLKKEKLLIKSGWASCKNKFKKKRAKVDSGNEDDAMMSDSKTVVDLEDEVLSKENILQPHSSFSSFSDIKNAGVLGQNANETFFHSFQAFQKEQGSEIFSQTPRSNFSLQKTSSSDLNVSEKSPQSDHYYSEHSMNAVTEVREIRAGCRRVREERPGFLILSAANEQLSKFLQDSCQTELKLPSFHDPEEREKLESLAKLYSLELQVEMGRPILRKTSNTMQAIRVEHCHSQLPSDHKRRCYDQDSLSVSDQNSTSSSNELDDAPDLICDLKPGATDLTSDLVETFSHTLVDKSLLNPGDLD
ncbi:uncharacterized protein LOC128674316 [Plodia interpunctella]|uniref:uncharacterized protein LOC128674316 n=1 Tax=Plodia interpunctella TaxID=58824 RepID=UPI0023684EA2|nr:uncharacterized protein LOC128674316 [Plodia interpunctella]